MRCGSCKEPPSLRHALRALSAAPGRAKPPQSLAQWVSPKWGRSMESLDETRENEGYLCERSKIPPPSWGGPLRSATGMLREGRRGLDLASASSPYDPDLDEQGETAVCRFVPAKKSVTQLI